MKKNKLHILTITILSVLTAFLFTSCFDPIYHSIRIDVKPEKPTVNGDSINSIARYTVNNKEYLVLAANGGLRYKDAENATHGSWKTYGNLPFEITKYDKDSDDKTYKGETIAKVLADTTNLYLVTVKRENGTNRFTAPVIWTATLDNWNAPSSSWSKVENFSGKKLEISTEQNANFNVFSTNDPKKEYRKVYVRIDTTTGTGDSATFIYDYFLLNGKETPAIQSSVKTLEGENLPANSAVAVGGETKFFNSIAVASNGTAANNATKIYYGKEKDLYYSTDSGSTFTKSGSAGAPIASLAVTSDSILIGCGVGNSSGGIKRAALTNDVPGPIGTDSFTTNAPNQMPNYYQIPCLLNVTPEKSEKNSIIYSAVTFIGREAGGKSKYSDKGLWSYYPNRGNWNRE